MSLLFEGRLSCFKPVTYMSRAGITQIRPMLYAGELRVARLAQALELPGGGEHLSGGQGVPAAGDQAAAVGAVGIVPGSEEPGIRGHAAAASGRLGPGSAAPAGEGPRRPEG